MVNKILYPWNPDPVEIPGEGGASAIDEAKDRLIDGTVPELHKSPVEDSTSDFADTAVAVAALSSPVGRYDAKEIALSNGTLVTTWANQRGGADLSQATAGNKMTFRTADANNMLPSLDATTASRFMDAVADMTQPCTIIVILDVKSIGANSFIFDGDTDRLRLGEHSSGGTFFIDDGTTGPTNVGTAKTGTQFMAVRFDGTSTIFDHDTTRYTALNVGTGGLDTFRLGANSSGLLGQDARYHEIILIDGAATNADIDDWYDYSVSEWLVGGDYDSAAISAEATADGADHLFLTDETSGTTLTDDMGTTNGTIHGSPTLDVAARYDLRGFTGNVTPLTDYASLSSSAVQSDSFSIICRFKTTATNGSMWGVGASSTNRVIAYVQSGILKVQSYNGSIITEVSAGYGYNDGLWHTLACRYTNGPSALIAMWVDGEFIGETAGSTILTVSGAWLFADGQATSVDGFDGTVSVYEMYGSAKSDAFMLAKSKIH